MLKSANLTILRKFVEISFEKNIESILSYEIIPLYHVNLISIGVTATVNCFTSISLLTFGIVY